LVTSRIERIILPISLHLNNEFLNSALQAAINQLEEPGYDLLLGYGLCGRGVEGACSQKSRLILPKVDDCVGAMLGSRQRPKQILSENAGCFFLEPTWIGTEVDIFCQCLKGLDKIPEEYRGEIINMALRHYSKLVLIDHEEESSITAIARCRYLARKHNLEFVQLESDLSLLEDLAAGKFSPERFVIVEPGQKIPNF
jgi:hypothetical protein